MSSSVDHVATLPLFYSHFCFLSCKSSTCVPVCYFSPSPSLHTEPRCSSSRCPLTLPLPSPSSIHSHIFQTLHIFVRSSVTRELLFVQLGILYISVQRIHRAPSISAQMLREMRSWEYPREQETEDAGPLRSTILRPLLCLFHPIRITKLMLSEDSRLVQYTVEPEYICHYRPVPICTIYPPFWISALSLNKEPAQGGF